MKHVAVTTLVTNALLLPEEHGDTPPPTLSFTHTHNCSNLWEPHSISIYNLTRHKSIYTFCTKISYTANI